MNVKLFKRGIFVLALAASSISSTVVYEYSQKFAERSVASSQIEEGQVAESEKKEVIDLKKEINKENVAGKIAGISEKISGIIAKKNEIATRLSETKEKSQIDEITKEIESAKFDEEIQELLEESTRIGSFLNDNQDLEDASIAHKALTLKFREARKIELNAEMALKKIAKAGPAVEKEDVEDNRNEENDEAVEVLRAQICKQKNELADLQKKIDELLEDKKEVVDNVFGKNTFYTDYLRMADPFQTMFSLNMPGMLGQQNNSSNFWGMMLLMQSRQGFGFGGSSMINYAPVTQTYNLMGTPMGMNFSHSLPGSRELSSVQDPGLQLQQPVFGASSSMLDSNIPRNARGQGLSGTISLP